MAGSTAIPSDQIDWDALHDETVRLLCEYIRIDTSNPPGNEALAVAWLTGLLRGEGIAADRYDHAPGRASLIARLPGTDPGVSRPDEALVLLNHTDVVPVQAEFWSQPAFAGLIHEGCIWGRGALDMKSLGILELMSFLLVKRLNLPHRRDLVFFAVADEEAGSEFGIEWFARHRPELLRAYAVINEGGGASNGFMGSDRQVFSIAAAEKSPLWLRLRTTGRPGHASMPHDDNALDRLVRALYRVSTWERPRRLVPEVLPYLRGLAAAGLIEPIEDVETAARVAARNPQINAMTLDTISLTGSTAGVKVNVIPATCEATLDCRLLPGKAAAEFIAELRARIDDDRVIVEEIFAAEGPSSAAGHELTGVIERVVKEHVEDAIVLPGVTVGFTDSRTFRRLGVPAYGFSPTLATEEERRGVHGHDERVQVESLRLGLQILFEIVRRLIE